MRLVRYIHKYEDSQFFVFSRFEVARLKAQQRLALKAQADLLTVVANLEHAVHSQRSQLDEALHRSPYHPIVADHATPDHKWPGYPR